MYVNRLVALTDARVGMTRGGSVADELAGDSRPVPPTPLPRPAASTSNAGARAPRRCRPADVTPTDRAPAGTTALGHDAVLPSYTCAAHAALLGT